MSNRIETGVEGVDLIIDNLNKLRLDKDVDFGRIQPGAGDVSRTSLGWNPETQVVGFPLLLDIKSKSIIKIQKTYKGYITRKILREKKDNMTIQIVEELLDKYIENLNFIEKINLKLSVKKCRNDNFPSHISENIVKFILFKKYNIMPCWDTSKGDLTLLDKQLEIKGFMSSGPSSFGPTESWDWIYFLDAIDCRNKNFKLYEIKLSNNNLIWKDIIMSKKAGNYGDIAKANKRGQLRASFHQIFKPQLKNNCKLIFNGNISELNYESNSYYLPLIKEASNQIYDLELHIGHPYPVECNEGYKDQSYDDPID